MAKKVLIGFAAAIVLAVAGFFGFGFYMQQRVAGEIDATFEQIRASGGKASHGKVSFDVWSRTVTVADIAGESAAQPPLAVKIASFTASGVTQTDPARFSADTIEVSGIEFDVTMAAPTNWHVTYRVPRIAVKDYSGPTRLQTPPASSSMIDLYRFAVEQFTTISASSITAPSLAGTIDMGAFGGGDFAYTNLSLTDLKQGRIAANKVERASFTVTMLQTGKPEKLSGEIQDIATLDFDAAAIAAILDPQKADDDKYQRVYRQLTAGPYTITSAQGPRIRIEGFTVEDVGLRPGRLQLPALMAALPKPGTVPSPAQGQEMLERAARVYEGVRAGKVEMRALSVDMPQGPLKLAALRLNLDNGKVGEFAMEGLDARGPQGPVKVERFALKSLDIANLLRMSAQVSTQKGPPPPEQGLWLFLLLEGAEIKGMVTPYKGSATPVNIETLDLSWGQLVGPIPTKARVIAKLSGPIDNLDPAWKALLLANTTQNTAAINLDLGAVWNEAAHTFVLEPAKVELGGFFSLSARFTLGNVTRNLFSLIPAQASAYAAQIDTGRLELMLRDLGGVDLGIAQYARIQNVSRDDARREIVDRIKAGAAGAATPNPDAIALADALAGFVENPKGTLTLRLTPRDRVQAMELLQSLKTDPLPALARFQVEVSTGR